MQLVNTYKEFMMPEPYEYYYGFYTALILVTNCGEQATCGCNQYGGCYTINDSSPLNVWARDVTAEVCYEGGA